jgi:hypothetical protein
MADDSLVVDNRAALGAAPGLHAILIGVSDYANLAGPDDPAGEGLQALKKLESAAICASSLADKIKALDAQGRLFRPLKTLRLLIAPSATELEDAGVAAAGGAVPTRANIQQALEAWREDVGAGQKEMSLFYYGGHGLREMEDNLLLASDFLAPGADPLAAAFKLSSIRNGMTSSEAYPNMGLDQFYFIDACREQSDILETLPIREPPPVFAPSLNNMTDKRRAPLYFATPNGGIALSDAGVLSGFTRALVIALDHAAPAKRWNEEKERMDWPINATSLKNGIQYLDSAYKGEGKVELTGLISNPVLCYSLDPPELTLKLRFAPSPIRGKVESVSLIRKQDQPIPVPGKPEDDPRLVKISPGMYSFELIPKEGAFANPYAIEEVYISIDLPTPHFLVVQ